MRVLVAEDDQVIADFGAGPARCPLRRYVASTGPRRADEALDGGYDAARHGLMLPASTARVVIGICAPCGSRPVLI